MLYATPCFSRPSSYAADAFDFSLPYGRFLAFAHTPFRRNAADALMLNIGEVRLHLLFAACCLRLRLLMLLAFAGAMLDTG